MKSLPSRASSEGLALFNGGRMKIFSTFLILGILLSTAGFAMDYESIRLTVWRKGEGIAGEEFVAANEGVLDYLSTLKHPTDPYKSIHYQCSAKGQSIRPSVMGTPIGSSSNLYVWVRTVYDLKDCKEE